jgi:RNA polymerase sigma factor (sigma-70 family)
MKIEPEVVEAACKGDVSAMDRLLARSRPDLKRFARRVCGTSEDAEDAVQVALWKMHRHVRALRSVAAFASWAFRIIERECFRALATLRRTEPLPDGVVETLAAPDMREALRHDLVAALASLPPTYSQILILRDLDEWTAPEVADHLGITVEAAKSRLHRARALMRECLAAGAYGPGDAGD